MNHRTRRIFQIGTGAILGLVVAAIVAMPRGGTEEPKSLGLDVPLIDASGSATSLGDFNGGFTFLFFGFTHCPDVCPVTLQRLAAGLDALDAREPGAVPAVTVAMVTVDPERDSPDVLADYLAPFGARFVGLTGHPDDLARLTAAYDVVVQNPEPGEALAAEPGAEASAAGHREHMSGTQPTQSSSEIAHTARIHVLDREGRHIGEIPPWPGAKDMADALADALGLPSQTSAGEPVR